MKFSYEHYHEFSAPLEGRVRSPYVDVRGLITVGVGNLIDPISLAERLPWVLDSTGERADMAQVRADWHRLKANAVRLSELHWKYAAAITKIRLTDKAIDDLCLAQLASNEAQFRKRYSRYDEFPADAQLALHSMGWAVGAAFWTTPRPGFVNLDRYIAAQDWEGCVASCKIKEERNPGVVPRNAKNRFCFHNAALTKGTPEAETLQWPNVAPFRVSSDYAAVAADLKRDAEIQQAAWYALDVCPFTLPTSSDAIREFENA